MWAALCTAVFGACKTSPATLAETLPDVPGAGACRATTTRGDVTTTTRWVVEANQTRELIDTTGDGEPDLVKTSTLDAQRRVVEVVTTRPSGETVQREQLAWDGMRLVARRIDKFDERGLPGVDGVIDEVHTLHWDGDRLVRETVDQLDEHGALGSDGEPELVTEWTWQDGARVRGVKTDVRDGAVLQTVGLVWVGGVLAAQTIDLGGDGTIDLTIQNTWVDHTLQEQIISGTVDNARTVFEYCR